MAEIKGMVDDHGTIYTCNKKLPEEFKLKLVEVLAELQDNECHVKHQFPKSQLHKIEGVKYGDDKRLHLCEMLEPAEHDRGTKNKVIKQKKKKYS